MSHRVTLAALLVALLLLPGYTAAARTVVLVTSESCPISEISSLNVRKAYLGVAVTLVDRRVRPMRLNSDEKLSQIFYQSIVAMSEKSYERRALSLALKFGTPRPAEFSSLDEALATVRRIECSMVYAWSDQLDGRQGIKSIRVLWRGE